MLRATLRSLAARKLRLVLTATAIILGVAFITGTLVLIDTSTRLFDDQFAEATAGVDVVIRDAATFGDAMGVEVERDPVPDAVLDEIRSVDGVAGAEGIARGSALLIIDGEAIVPAGASVGSSWTEEPYNAFTLREGRDPRGPREVVIDRATAIAGDVTVGDSLTVTFSDGGRRFDVVGIAGFGEADGIPNATVALFAADVAQELFGTGSGWSEVQVVADGVPADELRDRLTTELGTGFEITTSRDTAAASAQAAQDQLVYLKVMLLVLAVTALVVGAFMIANSFAIVVTQRTREFATLRALGASGRQILGSVITEAAIIGTLASAAGVAVGVGQAALLRRLAGAFGVVIPDGPLTVQGRTLATGMAIGTIVTLLASISPARRAARTAPVVAMRDGATSPRPLSRGRSTGGGATLAIGLLGLAGGAVNGAIVLVGVGGVLTVAGVLVLAPLIVARVVGAIPGGHPVARLARTNLVRARHRTAATSAALAVGLAVVTFATVVANSARAGIAGGIDDVIRAELVIQSSRGEMLGGLSPHVHHRVSEVDGVATAARMRFGHWLDGDATQALTAIDPQDFTGVADLDLVAGDLARLDESDTVVVGENVAEVHGLDVEDRVRMRFSRTGEQTLEVVAILDADDVWAVSTPYLISLDTFARHFTEDVDASVFVKLADGAELDRVRGSVEEALAEFPTAAVHDHEEAKAARMRMLDSMLGLVTVLVLLAVLIALLGITNTLALSIVERTREVGMLRAVGATRVQISRMVRTEAAVTAAFGGSTGLLLGVVLAAATVRALAKTAVVPMTVPPLQLLAFVSVATLGGVIAGVLPGRRAARMDVLAAIAH